MKTLKELLNEGGVLDLAKLLFGAERTAAEARKISEVGKEVKVPTPKQTELWQLSVPRTTSEKEAREQLVDLRQKVNDQLKADTEKFGTKASSTILTSPDVPTFDDFYRRIYGDDWEKIARERAEALNILQNDPRLRGVRGIASGVPYGEYQRLLREPERAPTYLNVDFNPTLIDQNTFGTWVVHPSGFSDVGELTLFPRLIGSEAQSGTNISLRNVMGHEYGHAFGDIDWSSLPADTQFVMRGSRERSKNPFSLSRIISKEQNSASLVDRPKDYNTTERLLVGPGIKGINPKDAKIIEKLTKDRDTLQMNSLERYLTGREAAGQFADLQAALRDAGLPIVGPSNIFDKDYGVEAFKTLRNKFKLLEPVKELSPLLLDPRGRALIAPQVRKAKGSEVSDKMKEMRLA